jgi:hypothetical protein
MSGTHVIVHQHAKTWLDSSSRHAAVIWPTSAG